MMQAQQIQQAQVAERQPYMIDKSNVKMQVQKVYFAHPLAKDADPATTLDVVMELIDEQGDTHLWRSEYSATYGKAGTNFANKTRAETTIEALASVGWAGGHDLAQLESAMTGKMIIASVKWNQVKGNWYKNVYLGESGPRKMDNAQALNIIQAITNARSSNGFGGQNNFGAQPPQPPPQGLGGQNNFGAQPPQPPPQGFGGNAAPSGGFVPFK